MKRLASGVLLAALSAMSTGVGAQTLLEFYHRALDTNPGMLIRGHGVEQARAQGDIAASRLRPQVSFIGEVSRNDLDETGSAGDRRYTGTRRALQARQALLDLASYFRVAAAKSAVSQAEQQRTAMRMALAGEVVDRYLAVLESSDEIARLQAEMTAVQSQMDRLRAMRERQLAKLTDVFEVEAYYRGLQTQEIEARNAQSVALERLRESTGVDAPRVPALAREIFAAVPGQLPDWVEAGIKSNPNLVALEQAIETARNMVKSTRSEHAPQVTLSLSQTHSDQGFDNRSVASYQVGTIALQLNIPIYAGGRVEATTREAVARFEQARQTLEGARREIEREVRTAYLNAMASHARIDSTKQEVRAQEQATQAHETSFKLGIATIIDVLASRQRLLRALGAQSKARYDYIRDVTGLHIHSGALSPEYMEALDRALAVAQFQFPVSPGASPRPSSGS